MTTCLKEEDISIRRQALKLLLEWNKEVAVETLLAVLRDPTDNFELLKMATTKLLQLNPTESTKLLSNEIREIRMMVLKELINMNFNKSCLVQEIKSNPREIAIELLILLLKDKKVSINLRISALNALKELNAAEAVSVLLVLLEDIDENKELRNEARDGLLQLGAEDKVKLFDDIIGKKISSLIEIMKDKNRDIMDRQEAMVALIKFWQEGIMEQFKELIFDDTEKLDLREKGLKLLMTKAELEESRQILTDFLSNKDIDIKFRVQIISELPRQVPNFEEILPFLLMLLRDKTKEVRIREELLLIIRDRIFFYKKFDISSIIKIKNVFIEMVSDESEDLNIRKKVIKKFVGLDIDRKEKVELLIEMLKDKNEELKKIFMKAFISSYYSGALENEDDVRGMMIRMIRESGVEQEALKILTDILYDKKINEDKRAEAIRILMNLGSVEAINSLSDYINKGDSKECKQNIISFFVVGQYIGRYDEKIKMIMSESLNRMDDENPKDNLERLWNIIMYIGENHPFLKIAAAFDGSYESDTDSDSEDFDLIVSKEIEDKGLFVKFKAMVDMLLTLKRLTFNNKHLVDLEKFTDPEFSGTLLDFNRQGLGMSIQEVLVVCNMLINDLKYVTVTTVKKWKEGGYIFEERELSIGGNRILLKYDNRGKLVDIMPIEAPNVAREVVESMIGENNLLKALKQLRTKEDMGKIDYIRKIAEPIYEAKEGINKIITILAEYGIDDKELKRINTSHLTELRSMYMAV